MDCKYADRDDVVVEYVEGTLTGDEREEFEAHFFGCDRCFAQLQMTEKLIGTMQTRGEEIFASFRNQAGSVAIPVKEPPGATAAEGFNLMGALQKAWHLRWQIAARVALAGVLIVLLASWFLKYFVLPIDYKSLTAVQPSPWPEKVNTANNKVNDLVAQAREQFNDREYGGASNTLNQAVGLEPTMATLKYLLGASCYLANDTKNAITHLKDALRLDPYLYDARWYLAHAYLKNRDRQAAIEQLVTLVEQGDSGYGKSAREILKEIDPLFFLGRGF
jgi:tetratricopeptide (TPR) repeat protein